MPSRVSNTRNTKRIGVGSQLIEVALDEGLILVFGLSINIPVALWSDKGSVNAIL